MFWAPQIIFMAPHDQSMIECVFLYFWWTNNVSILSLSTTIYTINTITTTVTIPSPSKLIMSVAYVPSANSCLNFQYTVDLHDTVRTKLCRSRPNVVSNWLPMLLLLLHLDRLFVTSIVYTLFNSLHLPWRTYYFSLDKPGEQQERGFGHWKAIATAIINNNSNKSTTTTTTTTTCRDPRVLGIQGREKLQKQRQQQR